MPYDCLLGSDVIISFHLVIFSGQTDNRARVKVSKYGTWNELPLLVVDESKRMKVIASESCIVEANAEVIIEVNLPDVQTGTITIRPNPVQAEKEGLTVDPGLIEVKNHKARVVVRNLTAWKNVVRRGMCLSFVDIEDADEHVDVPEFPGAAQVNPDLSADQIAAVRSLLDEFADIFSSDVTKLGHTSVVKHHIELVPGAKNVYVKQYRNSRFEDTTVKELVDAMESSGIISPTNSNFNSPWLLVRKTDNSFRFVVDFRRLNAVTVKDRFPLPHTDVLIQKIGGNNFFSLTDATSGFHQIELDEQSKPYTAFTALGRHYAYNRLPMGLATSPASFQRLMTDHVLKGIEGAGAYIDDILIFTKTFEQHVNTLRQVFDSFRKHTLKLSDKKCKFGYQRLQYLGFEISKDGLTASPSKIEAVQKYPEPKSQTDVRKFLGFVSFYRIFIKDFASIAAPLNSLLRKDSSFAWTDDCQKAFESLRNALIAAPILSYFDDDKDVFILTDASAVGIAAVLVQDFPTCHQCVDITAGR